MHERGVQGTASARNSEGNIVPWVAGPMLLLVLG